MKDYSVRVINDQKKIFTGHIKWGGSKPDGETLSFTNYYMEKNNSPFFGICGEFHYSRYNEHYWEDELIKIKMCGVNIIATYVFWNFHEEIEGQWDWSGDKNLRKFIELCAKHNLYVIIRIGPFDHGEVRNGGIPDWMFGKPFELRSNDEGYLEYTKILYNEIGRQVKGLLYKDGGPIIGTQLENEHNHASSPWTHTTGTSDMWLPGGRDGDAHLLKLKELALEAGIETPLYTCTAWGGATTPYTEMLPLWGGYAYWPWIFYEERHGNPSEHPATPEYIFRDKHNNSIPKSYNYEPGYNPEDYPYSCCEMGGGMTPFYKYRFYFPYESVPAMVGIKTAEGCNFIGYYMFHGGSNPKGKRNTFMNEASVPKISYDYNAPIGEFGQVRDSYRRIKLQHYFFSSFEDNFCKTKTILPCDTSSMDPYDTDTLRYAVRSFNGSGFLFINNFQDHVQTKDLKDLSVTLELENENIKIPEEGDLQLAKDNSCILPFNLDIEDIRLKYSTTQLITHVRNGEERFYFFFIPEGMKGEYCFERNDLTDIHADNCTIVNKDGKTIIKTANDKMTIIRLTSGSGTRINICTLTARQSMNFWKTEFRGMDRAIITDANLLISDGTAKLEVTGKEEVDIGFFPAIDAIGSIAGAQLISEYQDGIFQMYRLKTPKKDVEFSLDMPKPGNAVLSFGRDTFSGLKELLLQVDYVGDVGYAFIDGDLINDNFSNNTTWEIGLKRFEESLMVKGMYIYISPVLLGKKVHSDTTMAGWSQSSESEIAEINSVRAVPVYEVIISG